MPAPFFMSRRAANGFTLVEPLIVVAVIGIVAAIAAPGFLRSRMTSNDASAIPSAAIPAQSQ